VCTLSTYKRTFQFSYRGWSTVSERIYTLVLCVYIFFLQYYIMLKSVNSARCVSCCMRTLYEVKIRSGTPMCCGTATTTVIFRRRARERVCARLSEQYTWRRKTDCRLDITFSRTIKIKTQFISYIHNNNIPPTTYLFRWIPIYTTSEVVARPSSGLDRFRSYNETTTTTMYYVHNSVLYNI